MNIITSFCLKNRAITLILSLALICASLFIARSIPIDVFPELRVPRVTIQTEATGLSAEEVEQYITIPIESAMNGTAGVKAVRSSSGGGLSFVWVDFDWDTDIYRARQIVTERLATVRGNSLSDKYSPELAPIVSVTGEIMLIALSKENASPSNEELLALRHLAEYKLRNRLLAIPGVGQVTVLGGRLPEYQIVYSPERLQQMGVSFSDLKTAVENASSNAPAGYLEDVAGLELPIQQDTRTANLEQIKRSIVPAFPQGIIRVEDLAEVKIDGAPRRGNAGFMSEDAIILSVQKIPGANTLALTQAVDAAVKEFSASQLPAGTKLHTNAYRQSDFINLSLENGKKTLFEAAIVVIIVVILTLLNLRTTLVTLLSMPLSILLALLAFPPLGLAINIMTLGGLAVAIGDVVDNSIIFVEIAWRRLSQNALLPREQQKSKFEVLMAANKEIISSIAFSSAIILLVFTPVLFLSGLEGQFFRPLGIAYMLALAASLLVAITIVPVLCAYFFTKKALPKSNQESELAHKETATIRLIKKIYAPILTACLNHAKKICAAMALLTGTALWLASSFGTSFLPPFNEDCYTVFINAVPGTSLEETERIARTCMKKVEKIPGVLSVAQRTGRAENDEHAEPVSASELLVRIDLNRDQKEIRAAIQEAIAGIPGTSTMIGYPLAHRISSALSGSNSEMAINIYGSELPQLRLAAQKAKEILEKLPEVADARANREVMVDTIRIRYDQELLSLHGITIAETAEQVSAALNGEKLGEVIQNQDRWNILLRLDPEQRKSIDDIRELLLLTNDKRSVQLKDVAEIYREEITNLILRDGTLRKAMISCNPAQDSSLGDLVKACQKHLDPAMHALGCTVDYAGTIQARESAAKRLYLLGAIIIITIVVLLASALGNARRAILSLINIPLCLIGGIFTIWLASFFNGTPGHPIISVASIVGFVTVIGFAIRSGLILLNRYKDLEQQGLSTREAILQGSLERVVPILMTSLTTILGLLPLIWAINAPGGELLGPLALVQFGGLISAMCLNLLVLPATTNLIK